MIFDLLTKITQARRSQVAATSFQTVSRTSQSIGISGFQRNSHFLYVPRSRFEKDGYYLRNDITNVRIHEQPKVSCRLMRSRAVRAFFQGVDECPGRNRFGQDRPAKDQSVQSDVRIFSEDVADCVSAKTVSDHGIGP